MVLEIHVSLRKSVTELRKDGWTDRCKPVYPPLFQSGGIVIQIHDQIKANQDFSLQFRQNLAVFDEI